MDVRGAVRREAVSFKEHWTLALVFAFFVALVVFFPQNSILIAVQVHAIVEKRDFYIYTISLKCVCVAGEDALRLVCEITGVCCLRIS